MTYSYKHDFDYSLWGINSKIKLCSVPWDSEYHNIVRFPGGIRERDLYLDGLQGDSIVLETASILKFGQPLQLPIPFSQSNKYNYVVVDSPETYDSGNKRYCYFITNNEQVSPNTTTINVMLDVVTTFIYDVEFESGYLVKGHYPLAKTANKPFFQNQSQITNKYLFESEGLDLGTDYVVCDLYHKSFLTDEAYNSYSIIIQSTVDLEASYGSVDAPNLKTARGTVVDAVPSGCSIYGIKPADFNEFMSKMSDFPWVSQNIASMFFVPFFISDNVHSETVRIANDSITAVKYMGASAAYFENFSISLSDSSFDFSYLYNNRYKGLKKFYTYPYSVIEITDNEGQSLILDPSKIGQAGDGFFILRAEGVLTPPFTRIMMYPAMYNNISLGSGYGPPVVSYGTKRLNGLGETVTLYKDSRLENALVWDSFPQFSIVTDSFINSMAKTAYSRQYTDELLSWNQTKGSLSIEQSYDLSMQALNTSDKNYEAQMLANKLNFENSQNAQLASAMTGTISSVAQGVAGGALAGAGVGAAVGGAVGLAGGLANTAISMNQQQQNYNVAQNLASATHANNTAFTQYSADANRDLANQALKGDSEMAIKAKNAQINDLKLNSPGVAGLAGGNGFNLSNGYYGFTVKFKRITDIALEKIANIWLRFGYNYNGFIDDIPNDLHMMSKYTYWKFHHLTYKNKNLPELFSNAILGIFERGVTVHADPSSVGKLLFDENEVL